MQYRSSTTFTFLAAVTAAQAIRCPDGTTSTNMNGVDLCCPGTKLSMNGEVMCVINQTTVPVTQPNYTEIVYGGGSSGQNSATPTASGLPTLTSGVVVITPGTPGQSGQPGQPGQSGEPGQPGQTGQPGQPGESGTGNGGNGGDGGDGGSSDNGGDGVDGGNSGVSVDGEDGEDGGDGGESAAPRILTSAPAVGLAAALLGLALL